VSTGLYRTWGQTFKIQKRNSDLGGEDDLRREELVEMEEAFFYNGKVHQPPFGKIF
jgi:hypothetical protein